MRWQYPLTNGSHKGGHPRDGACLLEAVSWIRYGVLDDHPKCVPAPLANYGRAITDFIAVDDRQRLARYIPLLLESEENYVLEPGLHKRAVKGCCRLLAHACEVVGVKTPPIGGNLFDWVGQVFVLIDQAKLRGRPARASRAIKRELRIVGLDIQNNFIKQPEAMYYWAYSVMQQVNKIMGGGNGRLPTPFLLEIFDDMLVLELVPA
jgi:hypothetical protein